MLYKTLQYCSTKPESNFLVLLSQQLKNETIDNHHDRQTRRIGHYITSTRIGCPQDSLVSAWVGQRRHGQHTVDTRGREK